MMFKNMVRGWFSEDRVQTVYNDFIQAMLDDEKALADTLAAAHRQSAYANTVLRFRGSSA